MLFQGGTLKSPAPLLLLLITISCWGAKVERVRIQSKTLGRVVAITVVLPHSYPSEIKQGTRFPVVYLLHCAGGSPGNFLKDSRLEQAVDSTSLIVVAPFDGTGLGWWIDSPNLQRSKLSTFISGELKNWVDARYRTRPDRANTGIAGHSMGGFGAFHNTIVHHEIYGAMFAAKALVDLPGHSGQYGLEGVVGTYSSNRAAYDSLDILTNAHKLARSRARIRFYSGPNDWFVHENRRLHHILDSLSIPHDYYENSEGHYPVYPASMYRMLHYFDSTFAQTPKP